MLDLRRTVFYLQLAMNNLHTLFIIVILSMTTHSHADNHIGISQDKTHLKESIIISQPSLEYSFFQVIAQHVLTEAYARIGKRAVFQGYPIKRSLTIADNGVTDGELARVAGLHNRYSNLIQISVPISYDQAIVYSKKYAFKVEGWQSLKPYKINYNNGFIYAEQKTKGMDVEVVTTVEQGLQKLNAGRSDLFIGLLGEQCLIKKLNLPDIKSLNPPLDTQNLFHYLHKRHKDLALKLEAVLLQMQESGELKAIQVQARQYFFNQCE